MGTSIDLDTVEDSRDDPQAAFIARMADKYDKLDEARERGDEVPGDDEEEGEGEAERKGTTDAHDDSDDDDSEDPETDTSDDDADGPSSESGEGSDETDEGDHTEDDESEESTDEETTDDEDDDATGEEDAGAGTVEEDEEDAALSEEFAKVAKALEMPVSLDDIKDPTARQLVAKKIKAMDAGYTRAMQHLKSFRDEQATFQAERKFVAENPDLVVIELLRKDPDLIDRVNARMENLGNEDVAKAFEITVRDKRAEATKAITDAYAQQEQLVERANHVESLAKRLAQTAGLPWEFAESAVERELLRRDPGKRDLTDDEVQAIVKAEAKNYNAHVRAHRREATKADVKHRLAGKKPTPGSKPAARAASPKPTAGKQKALNWSKEEERHARMMESARRIKPGVRDE